MRYLAIAAVVMLILVGVIFSTAGKKMMHSGAVVEEVVLPAPTSAGATLFKKFCGQCHGLPALDTHTAEDWPRSVERMMMNIAASGKQLPSENESRLIVSYLVKHAQQPR